MRVLGLSPFTSISIGTCCRITSATTLSMKDQARRSFLANTSSGIGNMPDHTMSLDAPDARRRARAQAALLGAVTGDAAAQTSHWNYDHGAFHTKLTEAGRLDNPEFFSSNSFYVVPVGGQSCYGDQLLEVARHIAAARTGDGDPTEPLDSPAGKEGLVNRLETAFGPGSRYGPYPPADPDARPSMPLDGPWRHASMKGFLDNLRAKRISHPDCGSDDSQADCIARAVPVACAYAGNPLLAHLVEAAVRSTQNSDVAVAYGVAAARILEACILGEAGDVITALRAALVVCDVPSPAGSEAHTLLKLVLEVADGRHGTLEQSVAALASSPLMESRLKSPVALIA